MKYLVEFNNGFEGDENNLTKGFDNLDEAIQYTIDNNDVYFNIFEGDYILEDGLWLGSGNALYTNCDDKSLTWFYWNNAEFVTIDNLAKLTFEGV